MNSSDNNTETAAISMGNGSVMHLIYFPVSYRILSTILNLLIFIGGVFGNIMVIIVIARTRTMHSPTNCYLLSLAVSDCLVLVAATLPAIPEAHLPYLHWPWGRAGCSIFVFLQYLGISTSALSITVFTVERYIAICHPMKAQILCTEERSKKIIAVMWIAATIYCSPWIALTTIVVNPQFGTPQCTFRLKRDQYTAYYMTDLIVLYVIPLTMSACMYGCIGRALYKGDVAFRSNKGTQPEVKHKLSIASSAGSKKSKARIQVVRMLAVIVAVFAMAWLPYRFVVVYNSFAKDRFINMWFLFFCRTMIYINSAINPLLYNAMSAKFRRSFKSVLCCCRNDNQSQNGSQKVHMSVGRTLTGRTSLNISDAEGRKHSLACKMASIKSSSDSHQGKYYCVDAKDPGNTG